MGLFGAGDPPCPEGSTVCSGQARTFVGRKTGRGAMGSEAVIDPGTGIYHASATKLNPDGSATTDVYIIKDGSWQKAATSNDGGKTYTFDDNVAGAGLQNELSNPQGAIHKNVDANINKAADKAGLPPTTKKSLLESNTNAAENDNDGESESSDSKPIASAPVASAPVVPAKAAAGTRNSFGDQVFPSDLAETGMDVIKFTMLEFKPRKIGAGPGGFGAIQKRDPAKNRNSIGTVMLPVPGGITDQNNADWGDGRINPLQAAGLDVAGKALAGGLEAGTAAAVKQFTDLGGKNATATKDLLKGVFAAGSVGLDPNEVLARTQGAVINPNLELLFKGPALRPFNFTFQMGARNEGDSLQIMEILRFFKQGSAPQRTEAQMLIKAPHTFQIEYLHRGAKNKFLNEIKECALLSVGVNYTPNNNYATFANGAPVSIELTLGFKELDPVFNDDYQGEGVGF